MLTLSRFAGLTAVVALSSLCGLSATSQPPQVNPAPLDGLRITLLGTGTGPAVNLDQFGASTLIEAGGERLLFDSGRGATLRLVEAGIPIGSVARVFLTHLHSDHIVDLPDLLLSGWANSTTGRRRPLSVWGPAGTVAMMHAIQQAFSFDIHLRRDVDEHFSAEGIRVVSRDIDEGLVFEEGGVRVTAFLVDHAPVEPAFGYRVDYRGRSVVLSGDTRFSENLIKYAKGVDVLIHEATDPVGLRARSTNPALTESVIGHHATPEQAGEVFSRVRPRLAVYSHVTNAPRILEQTRKTYDGPLEGPEDLLRIDVGETIAVHRRSR